MMTWNDSKKVAEKIVSDILKDLQNREGLQHAWESLDEETRREILLKWSELAHKELWDRLL